MAPLGRLYSHWVCVPRFGAGVGITLLCAMVARAQPMVRIRADSRIELQTRSSARGVEVVGSLLDDLGAPLSERGVKLLIDPESPKGPASQHILRTDAAGSFGTVLNLRQGRYRARAVFEGDEHDAASERARPLDLSKADLQLRFILPAERRLDLDVAEHPIALLASSAQGGAGLELSLTDERGTELARGRSGDDGIYRTRLPSKALGRPGMGRLLARTAGDARRSSAEAELSLLRFRRTSLTLRANPDPERNRVVLSGSLSDAETGLARKAIELFDGTESITTVLTDVHGGFRYAELAAPPVGTGAQRFALKARFTSDALWLVSSSSPVLNLVFQPRAAPSALWLLLPLSLCVVLLWLLSRREFHSRRELPTSTHVHRAGIYPTHPTRGSTALFQIDGEVRDAASGRSLPGVTLWLEAGSGQRVELGVTDAGRFHASGLPTGDWTFGARAAGYRELISALSLPHYGKWSNVQVLLENLRSAAVLAYKPAAIRALPSPELWERWTPRETLEDAMRHGQANDSFMHLTERVERAAYARTPPTEADVADIERAVRAARVGEDEP